MNTLQFNCIGGGCGLLSSVATEFSRRGYVRIGALTAVGAACVALVALHRWYRTHRATRAAVSVTTRAARPRIIPLR